MRVEADLKCPEWLPVVLAAAAFAFFAICLGYELVTYQDRVVAWANGDINSRAHLAAANLMEPLRTQDFRAIQAIGDACEADGVHLKVTSGRGGVVFSSRNQSDRSPVFNSDPCACGEYLVTVGMPRERVLAPFRKAVRGFAFAALVGITGVLLFFLITYRQRVRIRELKRLEEFRREFIADVSHEIKTPLTGILGAIDMMDGDSPLVSLVRKESVRLNRLVQSILDLARLERDGEVLNLAETDIPALVLETVDALVPIAENGGIRLTVEPSGITEGRRSKVDPQRIACVISNLVINAIRHSGSKEVKVSLCRDNGVWRLTVEDHGIGIPPEHVERIFDRFHRVDAARAAETGGAGLGLAISRRIARLHGGDVTYSPATPRGSRFIVTWRHAYPDFQ